MMSPSLPSDFRSRDICTRRFVSSTNVVGQTRFIISSLLTRSPRASTSTIRRSKARLPTSTGVPSASNWRVRGRTQNRRNRTIVSLLLALTGRGMVIRGYERSMSFLAKGCALECCFMTTHPEITRCACARSSILLLPISRFGLSSVRPTIQR